MFPRKDSAVDERVFTRMIRDDVVAQPFPAPIGVSKNVLLLPNLLWRYGVTQRALNFHAEMRAVPSDIPKILTVLVQGSLQIRQIALRNDQRVAGLLQRRDLRQSLC